MEMASQALLLSVRDAPEPELPAASAPPPAVLSDAEFATLLSKLSRGQAELPGKEQLRLFRVQTRDRLLWASQGRQLAAVADGGRQLLREAFERGLIIDPESLSISDAPWIQALWMPQGPPPQAASAFLRPVVITRFDGKATQISADFDSSSLRDVLDMAGRFFGDTAFSPEAHSLHRAGLPLDLGLKHGAVVKLSGLLENEHLNGKVGQVISKDGDQIQVMLESGEFFLSQENVLPCNANVVARNRGCRLDCLDASLAEVLGQAPGLPRVLWLERKPAVPVSPEGALREIKLQFSGMAAESGRGVSVGELRSFFWNLHLDDEAFELVRKRFAPRPGDNYVDLEDMLFILGRPHLLHPEVPIDALIYEAAASVLGRRMTAHIDKDLSQEDRGIGYRNACAKHCCGYVSSLLLQLGTFVCLVIFLLGQFGVYLMDPGAEQTCGFVALFAYLAYLLHAGMCVRLTRAFANATVGLEAVMALMDPPRHENPHFRWHVQCYHYETVHYTETRTDSEGRTRTEHKTRRERRNTHWANHTGILPSVDGTPPFVPQTRAQQTRVDTHLDLDFSCSNYFACYEMWCRAHHLDVHQDHSHSEDMPSRAHSCLAIWVQGTTPWWLRSSCYWLLTLCLCGTCYRWFAEARIGHQDYTYRKRCFNISPPPGPSGLAIGLAVGAAVAGVAAVAFG